MSHEEVIQIREMCYSVKPDEGRTLVIFDYSWGLHTVWIRCELMDDLRAVMIETDDPVPEQP